APYITAYPQATCPGETSSTRARPICHGRPDATRHGTLQAEIFPYSSLSSPSRAYISRSDTWNRRAVPPLLLWTMRLPCGNVELACLFQRRVPPPPGLSPEPSPTQHTEFPVGRKGSVIAWGSSCTRKQPITAMPAPPVSGLT